MSVNHPKIVAAITYRDIKFYIWYDTCSPRENREEKPYIIHISDYPSRLSKTVAIANKKLNEHNNCYHDDKEFAIRVAKSYIDIGYGQTLESKKEEKTQDGHKSRSTT